MQTVALVHTALRSKSPTFREHGAQHGIVQHDIPVTLVQCSLCCVAPASPLSYTPTRLQAVSIADFSQSNNFEVVELNPSLIPRTVRRPAWQPATCPANPGTQHARRTRPPASTPAKQR